MARSVICSYEVTAWFAAPTERVFALLADATSWPRWAGPLVGSVIWEREGDPAPGGARDSQARAVAGIRA